MKIHYIQHVPFEDLGYINEWGEKHGASFSRSKMYEGDKLPALDQFDFLVVMGGPMGVYDDSDYSWLAAEKGFIRTVLNSDKTILGICLGAQLIAEALGSKIKKNKVKEVGWSAMKVLPAGKSIFGELKKVVGLHWHGDTFDLPDNAERILQNEACLNQGFLYDYGRVVGLQTHFEIMGNGLRSLLREAYESEGQGPYIQSRKELIDGCTHIPNSTRVLSQLLHFMKKKTKVGK